MIPQPPRNRNGRRRKRRGRKHLCNPQFWSDPGRRRHVRFKNKNHNPVWRLQRVAPPPAAWLSGFSHYCLVVNLSPPKKKNFGCSRNHQVVVAARAHAANSARGGLYIRDWTKEKMCLYGRGEKSLKTCLLHDTLHSSSACTCGVMVSEMAHHCEELGFMGLSCSAPCWFFFFLCKMETKIKYPWGCKYWNSKKVQVLLIK